MHTEYIYGLMVEDRCFYVGRTKSPDTRLERHRADADAKGTLKQRVIYGLQQAGASFTMKILECGPADKMENKEELWRHNMKAKGHPLTNTRPGDSPLQIYERTQAEPWSIELFQNADWKKGDIKARKDEVAAYINGRLFLRTGKRKLRVWHIDYEYYEIYGGHLGDINYGYQRAINTFTPGTKEWETFQKRVSYTV